MSTGVLCLVGLVCTYCMWMLVRCKNRVVALRGKVSSNLPSSPCLAGICEFDTVGSVVVFGPELVMFSCCLCKNAMGSFRRLRDAGCSDAGCSEIVENGAENGTDTMSGWGFRLPRKIRHVQPEERSRASKQRGPWRTTMSFYIFLHTQKCDHVRKACTRVKFLLLRWTNASQKTTEN